MVRFLCDKLINRRKEKCTMKRNTLLLTFAMALVLVGSAMAATAKQSTGSHYLRMSGTIVSSSSSQLVLSSKIKGKSEQETFAVNPQTKTIGTLAKGEHVMVRYKNENNQKVATMIRVPKMAAAKSK
jgi:hypothetical protein